MEFSIDLGNTSYKVGGFEGSDLVLLKSFKSEEALVSFINGEMPEKLIIASVSQDAIATMANFHADITCLALDVHTPLPLEKQYHTPETLGVDRIAAAVGAWSLYQNKNILVVDLGTCITYDLILANNTYQGGAISPGMHMRLKALHNFTARLPLVEPKEDIDLIGKSTESSILSGVILGTAGEIETMIEKFRRNYADLHIIICGGDAKFFESRIKAPIFVVPELVLIGLNRILQYNVST